MIDSRCDPIYQNVLRNGLWELSVDAVEKIVDKGISPCAAKRSCSVLIS